MEEEGRVKGREKVGDRWYRGTGMGQGNSNGRRLAKDWEGKWNGEKGG